MVRVEKQFSIFLVNKPGVLAQVTGALAAAKINMIALTLMDASEHGVLRVVCEDSDKTREVLRQIHDHFTETDVLVMELINKPGAFASAVGKLAAAHINVNYAYCTGGARGGKTTAVFKVADLKKALRVLQENRTTKKDDRMTVKTPPRRR